MNYVTYMSYLNSFAEDWEDFFFITSSIPAENKTPDERHSRAIDD